MIYRTPPMLPSWVLQSDSEIGAVRKFLHFAIFFNVPGASVDVTVDIVGEDTSQKFLHFAKIFMSLAPRSKVTTEWKCSETRKPHLSLSLPVGYFGRNFRQLANRLCLVPTISLPSNHCSFPVGCFGRNFRQSPNNVNFTPTIFLALAQTNALTTLKNT